MRNMSFRLKFQYPVEDQSLSITWGGGRFWGASGSIESKGKGGISRHQKRIKGGGGFRKLTADSLPKRGGENKNFTDPCGRIR